MNGFPARPPRPRLPQVFITRPNDQPMGRKGEMQAQVEAHDPIPDAWKTLKIDVPGFCVFFVLCGSHIIWWLEVTNNICIYVIIYIYICMCCWQQRVLTLLLRLLLGLHVHQWSTTSDRLTSSLNGFDCSAQPQSIAISDDCLRNLNPDTRKFGQFQRSWFTCGYTPENQHRTWNLALGRGDSGWKPAF